jgi:hypothetical protein
MMLTLLIWHQNLRTPLVGLPLIHPVAHDPGTRAAVRGIQEIYFANHRGLLSSLAIYNVLRALIPSMNHHPQYTLAHSYRKALPQAGMQCPQLPSR